MHVHRTPPLLRPYRRDDLVAQAALFSDPDVMRFVGDGKPLAEADVARLFGRIFDVYASDPTFHVWAIEVAGAYAGHAELKRRTDARAIFGRLRVRPGARALRGGYESAGRRRRRGRAVS